MLQITDEQGQAFWRAADAARAVHDRYQFFVWLSLHVNRFIPHELALCRFRSAADTTTDPSVQVFYNVALGRELLEALPRARSDWWREVGMRWEAGGGGAVAIQIAELRGLPEGRGLLQEGFVAMAVHGTGARAGVLTPSLFAFATRDDGESCAAYLDLWLPLLHCTALRALGPVMSSRGDRAADARAVPGGEAPPDASGLTTRELQILAAVRDAKRNAQIGELLGISPLTVKNHLRKIMRKLNAGNRAQAVAEAMTRRLIV